MRNGGWGRYRREGLPTTSAVVESLIKQLNERVKGTQKFWPQGGPEAACLAQGTGRDSVQMVEESPYSRRIQNCLRTEGAVFASRGASVG